MPSDRTGIERYTEIYSMRGITAEEMPRLIIPNVMSRLRHLEDDLPYVPRYCRGTEDQSRRSNRLFYNKIQMKKYLLTSLFSVIITLGITAPGEE
ncbi:MAG: hypothetical protein MZV63_62490 [Marinilabiliales bacterium]|nr:hypothetical protein [Marinilabiliales bacterium]